MPKICLNGTNDNLLNFMIIGFFMIIIVESLSNIYQTNIDLLLNHHQLSIELLSNTVKLLSNYY